MADNLQKIMIEQNVTINAIQTAMLNFKKLSRANITLPKTKKRMDDLDFLWKQCQQLNVRLLQIATQEERKTCRYFVDEEFLAAESVYLETSDNKI